MDPKKQVEWVEDIRESDVTPWSTWSGSDEARSFSQVLKDLKALDIHSHPEPSLQSPDPSMPSEQPAPPVKQFSKVIARPNKTRSKLKPIEEEKPTTKFVGPLPGSIYIISVLITF
jgi:hypothetical protein